jgi:hypothetical protein
VFGDRVISRRLWPSRSPDLTPGDSYFWDNLKDIMNPHTEEELKENIPKDVLEVPREELFRVNFNLFKRHRM